MAIKGVAMKYARTWFEQFKGLMFDNTPNAEIEFEFKQPTRIGASIHTCFMRYPIKVQWYRFGRKQMEYKVIGFR